MVMGGCPFGRSRKLRPTTIRKLIGRDECLVVSNDAPPIVFPTSELCDEFGAPTPSYA
jgi:hypothetical protein